ncbi:MAG: hypothetical protein AAF039_04190 [Bacteroidota bacterium]
MKAYLKIVPYLGLVLGLLGLLLLLSFTGIQACQRADSDVRSIKDHTQRALETSSLEMAKYHGFKALSSLEKTKTHLNECGCEPAIQTAKDTEFNLKKAVRSTSLEDAKSYLKQALQNTLVTLDALKNFQDDYVSSYGDDILVMNTKEVLNEQGGILISPAKEMQRKMDQSLTEFETSLEAVVQHVDCEDAFNFITKIINKSDRNLERSTLTKAQRRYHTRVKTISLEALKKLEGCPIK